MTPALALALILWYGGGESLRGNEKLDVVGVLEGETRRVTAERVKPPA